MPASLRAPEVLAALTAARTPSRVDVAAPGWAVPRPIEKPFASPADWRDHWIYFLMVDRFNDPTSALPPHWDRATSDRQGGTLEGVRAQLPYLEALGAGAVWLTPVLKNPRTGITHHGYGTMDFLEVDPRLGSAPGAADAEFVRLVDEAHARGMYVILDIVINHAGDVFAYDLGGGTPVSETGWRHTPYPVAWRDEAGDPNRAWPALPPSGPPSRDAGVWPNELQANEWFRRQGKDSGDLQGDFASLKEFRTELTDGYGDKPVWNLLIQAYQYVVARYDVDGFRIDTLKHVEREFALAFCNAVREYALSIGKANFFMFGESRTDDEGVLAAYTGRYTADDAATMGADAALDFPLQWRLVPAVKGIGSPTAVQEMFERRKQVQRERHLLSTHGEASRFFVTFLDNHDDASRFLYPRDGGDYTDQLTLALGCLFTLQGIPCLYYGTEQGLRGTQELYAPGYNPATDGRPELVREALWGKPNAFDPNHVLYRHVQQLANLRGREPALRYGRQYFRPVSGNGQDFGFSRDFGGVLAFSRILHEREVLTVGNTSTAAPFTGWVVVDARLNDDQHHFTIEYSNQATAGSGTPEGRAVRFYDAAGAPSEGWARCLYINLAPMEVQVVARRL